MGRLNVKPKTQFTLRDTKADLKSVCQPLPHYRPAFKLSIAVVTVCITIPA